MAILAMILTASACRKAEIVPDPQGNAGLVGMTLTADAAQDSGASEELHPAATKTTLSGLTVLWQGSDRIGVTNLDSNHPFTNDNPQGTQAVTTFSGTAEAGATLYAYYPYGSSSVSSHGTLTIPLPQSQRPTADSFDPAADIMVSMPFIYEGGAQSLRFARLGAVVKLQINDKTTDSKLGKETLHAISLTAHQNLTGTVTIPLQNPSEAVITTGSPQLMASFEADAKATAPVHLIAFPQTLPHGSTLTFEAVTDNYTIRREIAIPASGIELKSAVLTPISVSITDENLRAATSVRIDFGQCSGKGETPSDWNKVTAYKPLESPIALNTTTGAPSGLRITALSGFNAEWGGSTGENQSWTVGYPEYTLPTAVWCDGLRITGTKGQGDMGPAKVILGGFDPAKYYNIDLLAFRFGGSKAARQCTYTIEGSTRSETKTIFPGTTSNWGSKGDVEDYRVRYRGITPADDGTLIIEVTGIDTGTAVDGLLNAVVINEYEDLWQEPQQDPADTEVTLTPTPERVKLLKNPFSGWAIYAGLGDGLANNFWDTYDNFPSSRGTIKVSDYASLLLIRMKWSEIEPQEGVYAWDPACTAPSAKRYRMLVEGARARGLKVVPSFRIDSRDLDVWAVPEYVKNKGAQGFYSGTKNVWTPYPDDPVFQEYFKKMLQALATQLDDPSIGGHIQGLGIGEWGEYHSCKYSTGDDSPREAVLMWMCDTFMEVFQNIPVVVNYHRMIGTGKKEGTPDPGSAALLDKAYRKGLCFGSGAFGMHQYYADWEKNFIAAYKYKVPVTMEGGWVRGSHSLAAIQRDGYSSWSEVRRGEYDDAAGAYVNVMDLRYNKNPEASECWSWFNDAFDLVDKFIQEGVYRIYPTEVTCPTVLSNGDSFRIGTKWTNLGWSYCPTNVPQYQKRYKVAYALLGATGEPVKVFIHDEADPSKWYKDQITSYTLQTTLSQVTPGRYTWGVAIVDVLNGNTPGIQLAVSDSEKTSLGWVKLNTVIINN